MAAGLRASFAPLIESLAGSPPRPIRLIRQLGIDKSLASRLVQAIRADDDARFLNACPSPTGLRMVLAGAAGGVGADALARAATAVDQFEDLIGALGGRQGLDAQLGLRAQGIRQKRESVSRQASFKALSFIFGHHCDHVVTAIFVVPSAAPGKVDFVEVHRRLGVHRLAGDVPIALMSLQADIDGKRHGNDPCISTLAGDAATRRVQDFQLEDDDGRPPAPVRVIDEGPMLTFVLDPAPASEGGQRVTTAMRVLRSDDLRPPGPYVVPRRYMLNTPCRVLTRDLYVAADIWPDAELCIDFYIPGPTGSPAVDTPPGARSHRRIQLTCEAEPLPAGPPVAELAGVPDHVAVLQGALARAGQGQQRFRGWRCRMAYPVPLIEMQIGFVFAGGTPGAA